MKLYLHKIFYILGLERFKLPKIILFFIILSILDLIGISLIVPYISLLSDPESINNFTFMWFDTPQSQVSLISLLSFALIIIFLSKSIFAIWVNHIIVSFSAKQQVKLRLELMKSYQLLPYEVYLSRNSSEYINSTQVLVNHFTNGVLLNGMKSLSDGILSIVLMVFLFITDPFAFLFLISLLGGVLFTYDYFFRKDISKLGVDANEANTKIVQGVYESIEGFKQIKILGSESFFYNQVFCNAKKYAFTHTRSTVISSATRYVFEFIIVLFIAILILYALYVDQDMSSLLTTLGVFGVASVRLLPAVNIISSSIIRFRLYRDSVSKLYDDLKWLRDFDGFDATQNNISSEKFKTLSMQKVGFQYQGAKSRALSQITLDINSGDSIGFIGGSGSGKTTLIDVMLGLLQPKEGELMFNGKKLENNIDVWRSHVAYIPQNFFLIDNTLKLNIALGVDESKINNERIFESLKMARLSDWLETLPDGINTKIGERGMRISGGQRQRIALARAFYHKKDVLIMDEATSALDEKIEQEVVKEIELLKGEITLIIIAHRMSTVKSCDKIFKIEKGVIVASGKPKQILS